MAKNPPPGDGHRHGQVTDRSQIYNPHNDRWVKRDTDTGRFMDQKADPKPFKGGRREKEISTRTIERIDGVLEYCFCGSSP